MNFADVMDRVGTVIEREIGRFPHDKEIAKELDMTAPSFSNARKRNSTPVEKVANFCARKRVSINWVLYEQDSNMFQDNTDDIFKITFLNSVNGSGGGEAINDNEKVEYLTLDRRSAERIGISNLKNVEAINLTGDSMEPTLKDGSIIVIDRTETDISGGGIFAVNTTDGLTIKRVVINHAGGVDLISDNKSYTVSTLAAEEVTILGKVVGALEKM